jgi:hypothetical protein
MIVNGENKIKTADRNPSEIQTVYLQSTSLECYRYTFSIARNVTYSLQLPGIGSNVLRKILGLNREDIMGNRGVHREKSREVLSSSSISVMKQMRFMWAKCIKNFGWKTYCKQATCKIKDETIR